MPDEPPTRSLESFREDLHRVATLRLGPASRAKVDPSDVVQITMLEAHRAKDRLDGRSDQERRGWLCRVLDRSVAHARRDQSRARRDWRREQPLDALHEAGSQARGIASASEQSTPSQCALRTEREERLAAALAALPDAQREAVALHYLHGLRLSEVAARLGRSPAAVGGLLHRGIQQLRARLDDLG